VPVQLSYQYYLSNSAPADEKVEFVKDEDYFKPVSKPGLEKLKSQSVVAQTSSQYNKVMKSDNSLAIDIGKDIDLDLADIRPVLKQAGNLAAYVNESETLQKLVKIGVNFHEIENIKERNGADLLMQLDFEMDIEPRLLWLHSIGIPNKGLGKVITKNPMILGESLDDMKNRVGYLESKKFSPEAIGQIVYNAPKYLTMDVKVADGKLGFYQKEFSLTGKLAGFVLITDLIDLALLFCFQILKIHCTCCSS
jgi:hypothetical protein